MVVSSNDDWLISPILTPQPDCADSVEYTCLDAGTAAAVLVVTASLPPFIIGGLDTLNANPPRDRFCCGLDRWDGDSIRIAVLAQNDWSGAVMVDDICFTSVRTTGAQEGIAPRAGDRASVGSVANRTVTVGPLRPGVAAVSLVDAAGRPVTTLRVGTNDVRRIAPGVYFLVEQAGSTEPARAQKVVVVR